MTTSESLLLSSCSFWPVFGMKKTVAADMRAKPGIPSYGILEYIQFAFSKDSNLH